MNVTYGYDKQGRSLAPKARKKRGLRSQPALPMKKYRVKREHLGTITPGDDIS